MKKRLLQMKFLFPLAIFVLIAVTVGASVRAQDQNERVYLPITMHKPQIASRWIGPEGGTVNVLAVDPNNANTLYAGTMATGVYKTVNGGANWSAANNNMKNLKIHSLAIDPKTTSILYAGTDGQGVYKSTDNGANWNPVNQGISANEIVYGLAVNPGNTDLVFAGTRTKSTNGGNLYKSTDKGANWSKVYTRTDNWFNALAINPNKPNIILAATEYGGPYITTTYGASGDWNATKITTGDRTSGRAVAFDPRSGNDRAYFSAWNNDFYRSTNNGFDWTISDSGLGSDTNVYWNGIAVDPNNSNYVYMAAANSSVAGVLKSTNLGQDWSAAGLKGKKVYSVALPHGAWNTVYAGTYGDGVYKSTDGGANWVRSATGLGASNVTGMVFDGTTYYSATYGGGIFKSTNAGASWTEFNSNLTDLNINGLVQHPTQPKIIFALTASSGVRRYDLNTSSGWTAAAGLPEQFEQANFALLDDPATAMASAAVGINGMAFAPSDANIAYIATNGGGIYKSTDSGLNFTPKGLTNEVVRSVAVNRTDPTIVYAATSTKGVVKKSIDGGSAWMSLALPDAQLQKDVYAVAMWPEETDKVLAGTSNGVWKYDGTSWTAAGLQGYTITSLVPDPKQPKGMFAGTSRGAFYSPDMTNWTQIESGIASTKIASFSFNPVEWSIVYLGTTELGALRLNLYR